MKRRVWAVLLVVCLCMSVVSCGEVKQTTSKKETTQKKKQSAEEIVAKLTVDQKAAQMVQGAIYSMDEKSMEEHCYGSILSKYDALDAETWSKVVDGFQEAALASDAGIPYLYGNDDVHGVNYCKEAVIFPHNIGIGAAHDTELTYQMGLAVADEAKLCHMLWNFAPCVAQSEDPRWGRTYESYGADLDDIKELSTAYTRGLTEGGIIACAKHFFGDGNVEYGSGEKSDIKRLIDRGNAKLTNKEIQKLLQVYQAQIDAGAKTIMVSHSSLNGIKMHENAKYLNYLKKNMKFKGFVVSDWNSVQNISEKSYKKQVITAVNAGIDMLMEVDDFEKARKILVEAVNAGKISKERMDDAVMRIIKVKLDEGIFEDPLCKNIKTKQKKTGSEEYRRLAEQLVEKSLVLLKNKGNLLPFSKGKKIYVMGPALDHAQAQCGGWTVDWNASPETDILGVTTILDGLQEVAQEQGITILTEKAEAKSADAVLLVVGEQAYAEWNGDTKDLELCGALGLDGNQEAIAEAKKLGKPIAACIVAGRQIILKKQYSDWDAVMMCYLPGSEGTGVANVLCGKAQVSGRLPSPWYDSVKQIGTKRCWLKKGYGLTY